MSQRYRDPKSTVIQDWKWLPLHKVQEKLGLEEIPSHVQKFGEFMDETARRASIHGLSPRDLIKAYTITRFSMQRTARKALILRKAGLILPSSVDDQDKVRPEGAFGHWLHTKHGQNYLDKAEAGEVDEEAIDDAKQKLRTFGKVDKDLPDALRWAPKNLPGREARVSELVSRALRRQSTPEEWRGEMSNLKGIRAAKAGFIAAQLGRGDQPTLDARQIVEHTGQPSSASTRYLSRQGGLGAAEGVQRLAARQTAMDLSLPKEQQHNYQHLAHHAFWDKAADETTTHADVMDAMTNAKDGGRIERKRGGRNNPNALHPLMEGMARAGLPGMGHLLTDVPQERLEKALKGVHSPFSDDPEDVQAALRVAQSLKVPTKQGTQADQARLQTEVPYYGIKQPLWPEEVLSKLGPLPGTTLKPKQQKSWQDLYNEGKGGHFVNLAGDRSRSGVMTHIMGKKLAWPVKLYAGPEFMREYNPGSVWASAKGVSGSLDTLTKELSRGNKPVYGIYAPMGAKSADSAHHMFDALMAQVPGSGIDKDAAAKFDEMVKAGLHMDAAKRPRVVKMMEKWPGIMNAKAASNFARTLPGAQRSAMVKMMDQAPWLKAGFPAVGATRVAITDPEVMNAPGNMIGHRYARLDPDRVAKDKIKHTTYNTSTAGEYGGELPLVQRQYAQPDSTFANMMKDISGGRIVHPYSSDNYGRGTARDMYDKTKVVQPINQEWLDNLEAGRARQSQYGLKKGGRVAKAGGGSLDMGSMPNSVSVLEPGTPDAPGGTAQRGKEAAGLALSGSGGGSGPPGNPGNAKEFLAQLANDPKTDPTTRLYAAGSLSSGAYTGSQGQEATKPSMADGGPVEAPPPMGHNQPPEAMAPGTPSYIKPIDEDRRQLSPLGLYSHAAEAVWKQPQMKASPQQFKQTLINKHGVKADEFKWTGYDQAFDGRPYITKKEVRDHFLKHMPKIEEMEYGAKNYDYDPDEGASGGTKYEEHTLPGGRNYREVVLHLPEKLPDKLPAGFAVRHVNTFTPEERRMHGNGPYTVFGPATGGGTGQGSFGSGHTDAAAVRAALKHISAESPDNYRSSHWDEPNVLAHLRLSDRKGAKGEKILHLEELQSDWGQAARKESLKPEEVEELARLRASPPADFNPRFQALMEREKGVPPAPYIDATKKWTELGLKRILHEAAKGNYDKVVITPGAEQAKRYDLSKHIDRVVYFPKTRQLSMYPLTQRTNPIHHKGIEPEKLDDYVGKDVAKKLLETKPQDTTPYDGPAHVLDGADLKIGGEGMQGYYDTILPKALEKLARQHDPEARVGKHALVRGSKGMDVGSVVRDLGMSMDQWRGLTNEERERLFYDHKKTLEQPSLQLHSLDITPRMRASILAGQKAFASGGKVSERINERVFQRVRKAIPVAGRYPGSTTP